MIAQAISRDRPQINWYIDPPIVSAVAQFIDFRRNARVPVAEPHDPVVLPLTRGSKGCERDPGGRG